MSLAEVVVDHLAIVELDFGFTNKGIWGNASVSCRDAMEGKKAENADEVGLETAQKMKTQPRTAPPQSRLERAWRRTYI